MKNRKMNILYVFADQWRAVSTGFECNDLITPSIDAFAASSIVFEDAVSTCPLCSPYRACLFTGKYPVDTGVYGNCMTGYPIALSHNETTLFELLSAEGYNLGYIGKWHLDEPELNHDSDPVSGASGWDAYTPAAGRHGIRYWHAYNADNNHLHPHYWEDSAKRIDIDCWSPEHETDKAIQFLEEQDKDKPFALFISWNPPHPPYESAPDALVSMYSSKNIDFRTNVIGDVFDNHTGEPGIKGKKKLLKTTVDYYAAISGLDQQFSRLLNTLNDIGLEDNTIVILTSDHGDMLGSHGLIGKHVWYEESVRVPFIIRIPGVSHAAINGPFSTVDILPTLLSLLHINCGKMDGRDVSDYILKGESFLGEAFLSCYVSRDVFIENLKEHGIAPLDSGWRAIRTNDKKLVISRGYTADEAPQIFLYDLEKDPYELSPMILSSPFDAGNLGEKLIRHLKEKNPGFADWIAEVFHNL